MASLFQGDPIIRDAIIRVWYQLREVWILVLFCNLTFWPVACQLSLSLALQREKLGHPCFKASAYTVHCENTSFFKILEQDKGSLQQGSVSLNLNIVVISTNCCYDTANVLCLRGRLFTMY